MSSNILCFPSTSGGVDFCSQSATDLYLAPLDANALGRTIVPPPRSSRTRVSAKYTTEDPVKPDFQEVRINPNGSEGELLPNIPAAEEKNTAYAKVQSNASRDFQAKGALTSSGSSLSAELRSHDQLENAATEFQKAYESSGSKQVFDYSQPMSKNNGSDSKVSNTDAVCNVPAQKADWSIEESGRNFYTPSTGDSSSTVLKPTIETKEKPEEIVPEPTRRSFRGGLFNMCRDGLRRRPSADDIIPPTSQEKDWPQLVEGCSNRTVVTPRVKMNGGLGLNICCAPLGDASSLGEEDKLQAAGSNAAHHRELFNNLNDQAIAVIHDLDLEHQGTKNQTFFVQIPPEHVAEGLRALKNGDMAWHSPMIQFLPSQSTPEIGKIGLSLTLGPNRSLVAQYHRLFVSNNETPVSRKPSITVWDVTYVIRDPRSSMVEVKADKWVSFTCGSNLHPMKIREGLTIEPGQESFEILAYAVGTERNSGSLGLFADVEQAYTLRENVSILVANGQNFEILRDVVQARSELLLSAGKKSDGEYHLEDPSINQKDFENLIDYIHTSRCSILESEDCDVLSNLYRAAEKYKVERLKAEIKLRMLECVRESSVEKYSDILS